MNGLHRNVQNLPSKICWSGISLTSLACWLTLAGNRNVVLTGETGLGQRRRSNRPGNSQAKGPSLQEIWRVVAAERRVRYVLTRRRNNVLRQTDRWGQKELVS